MFFPCYRTNGRLVTEAQVRSVIQGLLTGFATGTHAACIRMLVGVPLGSQETYLFDFLLCNCRVSFGVRYKLAPTHMKHQLEKNLYTRYRFNMQ